MYAKQARWWEEAHRGLARMMQPPRRCCSAWACGCACSCVKSCAWHHLRTDGQFGINMVGFNYRTEPKHMAQNAFVKGHKCKVRRHGDDDEYSIICCFKTGFHPLLLILHPT